jgi:hypothetical protein
MERATGIEPTSEAWEASIKLQKRSNWRHFDVFQVSQMDSNWSSGGFLSVSVAVALNAPIEYPF